MLKPTTGQAVYFLFWAAVAIAVPIGIYFWVPSDNREALLVGEVVVLAFLTLPLLLWCLRRSIGRTVLTGTGVTSTGAFLLPRSIAWKDVTAVRTNAQSNRGSSTATYVVLERARGRRIMLAAPYTNSSVVLRDEHFDSKLSQIRDFWAREAIKAPR